MLILEDFEDDIVLVTVSAKLAVTIERKENPGLPGLLHQNTSCVP